MREEDAHDFVHGGVQWASRVQSRLEPWLRFPIKLPVGFGQMRTAVQPSSTERSRSVSEKPGTAPGVGSAALRAARVGRARFDAQHVDVDQAGVVSVELDAVEDRPPHRAGDLPRRGER